LRHNTLVDDITWFSAIEDHKILSAKRIGSGKYINIPTVFSGWTWLGHLFLPDGKNEDEKHIYGA